MLAMSNDWIDEQGFRANVGIVIVNGENRLLLGGRVGAKGWQFPQGGVLIDEDPRAAMYRELEEEVGLAPDAVEPLAVTRDWLRYRLPDRFVRKHSKPLCLGLRGRNRQSASIAATNRSSTGSAGSIFGAPSTKSSTSSAASMPGHCTSWGPSCTPTVYRPGRAGGLSAGARYSTRTFRLARKPGVCAWQRLRHLQKGLTVASSTIPSKNGTGISLNQRSQRVSAGRWLALSLCIQA